MDFAILVTITGMVVVFAALIALSASIWLVGKVLQSFTGKKKGDGNGVKSAEKKEAAPATPAAKSNMANASVESGIPGSVIAAISAAVAMMMGGKAFSVKSIKRAGTKSSRPVWGQAGVMENTRPF